MKKKKKEKKETHGEEKLSPKGWLLKLELREARRNVDEGIMQWGLQIYLLLFICFSHRKGQI